MLECPTSRSRIIVPDWLIRGWGVREVERWMKRFGGMVRHQVLIEIGVLQATALGDGIRIGNSRYCIYGPCLADLA